MQTEVIKIYLCTPRNLPTA